MLIVATVLLGLAWGLIQGMVMFPPGIRLHPGFWCYHILMVMMMIGFWGWIDELGKYKINAMNILYLLGVLILLWEFSEIGYRLARTDITGWYEHICFFDVISIYLTGYKVALLHTARGMISIFLIWRFR